MRALVLQEKEVAKREREANKEMNVAAKQQSDVARRHAELDQLDAQVMFGGRVHGVVGEGCVCLRLGGQCCL